MNQTTQQLPSNPAIDFAQGIREETNNGLELIEILYDIARGADEDANTNDRITAANILTDRALGKTPRRIAPCAVPIPEPDDTDVEVVRESTSAKSESPRLVTKIDDALHGSLGPAPGAQNPLSLEGGGWGEGEMNTLDPNSIHFTIQQHILDITNNGQTLRGILLEIARACPEPVEGAEEDPVARPEPRRRVTPYHRRRAATLLLERLLGTDPDAAHKVVCPDCRRKRTTHDGSDTRTETYPKKKPGRRMSKVDPKALAEVHAELKRMEDAGILTPDPNAEEIDITPYLPPHDFDLSPYAKEEAAKFWANIELRYERQQQWPAIEERRRKKLAQIYPSHSDEQADPPDP